MNKKAMTENECSSRKGGSRRPQFKKLKWHAQPSTKVLWHKEEVVIVHVLSALETTPVDVVMVRQVGSSVVKRVTS